MAVDLSLKTLPILSGDVDIRFAQSSQWFSFSSTASPARVVAKCDLGHPCKAGDERLTSPWRSCEDPISESVQLVREGLKNAAHVAFVASLQSVPSNSPLQGSHWSYSTRVEMDVVYLHLTLTWHHRMHSPSSTSFEIDKGHQHLASVRACPCDKLHEKYVDANRWAIELLHQNLPVAVRRATAPQIACLVLERSLPMDTVENSNWRSHAKGIEVTHPSMTRRIVTWAPRFVGQN